MENLIFSELEFKSLNAKLDRLAKSLQDIQRVQFDKLFLDTEELCITMNISKRTAQQWRSENILPYSSIGRKYYYRIKDIIELLDKNYVPSK